MSRAVRSDTVENVRGMCERRGTIIGRGECGITWYVVDGKVWCILSVTQAHYCGDYWTFLDKVKAGAVPAFHPNKV